MSEAVLFVHSCVAEPGIVTLNSTKTTLGRSADADVAFENPFVSRFHAEVLHENDTYFLRDSGSKNGTFLNGEPVGDEPIPLTERSRVELGLGHVIATFQLGAEASTITHTPEGTPVERRVFPAPPGGDRGPGLVVDANRREVHIAENLVTPQLSRKEFDVLAYLYLRAGEACSKDDIAEAGWPERDAGQVSDQEITQCIHRIRRRIEQDRSDDAGPVEFIESLRGFGYRLSPSGTTAVDL
jgi:pSer/pThr/pTyr-binding forkhead associated (FHA) protein